MHLPHGIITAALAGAGATWGLLQLREQRRQQAVINAELVLLLSQVLDASRRRGPDNGHVSGLSVDNVKTLRGPSPVNDHTGQAAPLIEQPP